MQRAAARAVTSSAAPPISAAMARASGVLPQQFSTAYGLERTGATLVRLDGYIGARWRTAPDNRTEALVTTLDNIATPVNTV